MQKKIEVHQNKRPFFNKKNALFCDLSDQNAFRFFQLKFLILKNIP